jgi:DNA-binding IclR family transcriptional regulator
LDYNKLEVYLIPEKAMRDLDISRATFYRWLKVLLEDGFLEQLATNVYRLKPFMVVKGQMSKAIEFDF